MNTSDQECPNCGELVEVELHIDGECTRCGSEYRWEEYFDDENSEYDDMIVWE